jgi:mannose-6-phosphate isomerase-like protein (cupin superfamily)/sugar phosphate isomerase/epimerase
MHCCWSKTSFAEHCRLSAQLGAGYIEDFGYHLGSSRIDLSAARDALAEAKIPLLLVIAPDLDCSHPHDMESLARCIERWQEIGLTTFVTLRTKKGPDMKDFLVTLEAAASVVRHAGLMPLAQNHRGGLMESPDDLLRCREAGVDLHYDTQQWPMSGHDALTAWDQVGPYVRHAHLGDRTAEIEGCPFGTGIVRIRDLLQRMHAGGYRGAMTVETEYGPDDATGTAIVQQAIDFVTGVLTPFGATGIALPPGHAQVAAKAVKVIQTTWGTLHWISDGNVFADCGQTLGLVTVHAGWSNGVHRHPSDQEILYVRRGKCRHQCGDQEVLLEPGDVLFIPAGQAHGAVNIGDEPLELIVNYPTGHRSFESIRKAERIS